MEFQFHCFNDDITNVGIHYLKLMLIAKTHTEDSALKTEVLCNIYYAANIIFIYKFFIFPFLKLQYLDF